MTTVEADLTKEIATQSEWIPEPIPEHEAQLRAAGVDPDLAPFLARRGVDTAEGAERFLEPRLEDLLPTRSLPGIEQAVGRLLMALDRSERVAIVGDYDADGVTGTALLSACFDLAGLENECLLPHRLRDGYGFQLAQLERAQELGCSLLVTVDCGMSSHEALAEAEKVGVDVIVTDHHLPGEEMPRAAAVVNPRLEPDGRSHDNPALSGAGAALKLGMALLEAIGREPPTMSLLRVACIGTIADLVELEGENRVIASLGLQALGQVRSPGLRALLDVARVKRPVSSDDIGFRIGPRINAAGRLDSPDRALELLRTRDPDRARALASQLDEWNQRRQTEERRVVDAARKHFEAMSTLPRVLVAWSPEWHRGVVGIAAGRLAKQFNRPTILLQDLGDEATGSGRSIETVHLHRFLSAWNDEMERFGGHRQAIGLTVRSDRLERLRDEWNETAAQWEAERLVKRYRYEMHCDRLVHVRDHLYPKIQRLQPFGQGNPAPVLRVGPIKAARDPRVFGNGHLDLMIEDLEGGRIGLTAWHGAERRSVFTDRFEVLARLAWDDYLGTPSLVLVDARAL